MFVVIAKYGFVGEKWRDRRDVYDMVELPWAELL